MRKVGETAKEPNGHGFAFVGGKAPKICTFANEKKSEFLAYVTLLSNKFVKSHEVLRLIQQPESLL